MNEMKTVFDDFEIKKDGHNYLDELPAENIEL